MHAAQVDYILTSHSHFNHCMDMPYIAKKTGATVVGTESTMCTHNSLGVKGVGEAGTIGSAPAVMNAIVDALSGLGVRDVPMPASPNTVWDAIASAQSTTPNSSTPGGTL